MTVGYLEEIAALRQQRAVAEHQDRMQQLAEDYRTNVQLRDEAAQRGDADEWHTWDRECEQQEREWLSYQPVHQPQMDPRLQNFALRNKTFFDRYGQRADQVLALADAYLTRPKIPRETNPARTGMGLERFSPQYFDKLKSLLELHGKDYGVQYSRDDEMLTPDEAAKISGVSPRYYNRNVQSLMNQGRVGRDD